LRQPQRSAPRAGCPYIQTRGGEVERIAKAICNGDTNPLLFDQALVIAENEMVRCCVRVEAIALLNVCEMLP
jgi:hypothetical protein